MAKKDFTTEDRSIYGDIRGNAPNKSDNKDNEDKNAKKGKRPYTRRDATHVPEDAEEYRYTVRLPGEYGVFMNELAYLNRSSITKEFERLVKEEIERRPDVIKSIQKQRKAAQKK